MCYSEQQRRTLLAEVVLLVRVLSKGAKFQASSSVMISATGIVAGVVADGEVLTLSLEDALMTMENMSARCLLFYGCRVG